MWENVIGRSRCFWEYFYPRLQAAFPGQLGRIPLETFYRAVNKVAPTLLRFDADDVTYNLHIMLRLDLELQLLEGSLGVRDLPEAWHERMQADFGLAPGSDTEGVMQDGLRRRARLADGEHLLARLQVHRRRAAPARHWPAADDRALYPDLRTKYGELYWLASPARPGQFDQTPGGNLRP